MATRNVSESSDSDVAPPSPKRHGSRAFLRTFVHLEKRSKAMPTRREFNRLKAAGRVKQIAFTKNHASADMERLLLFHFPCLVDLDLSRLRFITSYDKGHAMSVVFRYIPSGEEIMAQFTQGPKQKVYMYWKGPSSVNLDDALPSCSTATSSSLPSTVASTVSTSSNPIPSASLTPSSTPVSTSTISSPVASFSSTGVTQPSLATTMSRPTLSLRTSDDDDNDDAVFMQSVFSDDVIEIDPPAINNFPVRTTSMESSTAKGYKGSPFYGSGLKGGLVVDDLSSPGLGDTETDTCDAVLQSIMARAPLCINDEHQQREQYVKWRKEKKEQEEELCALQKKDTREKQECRESEKPQVTASEKEETLQWNPCDDHDATVHKIREEREKRVPPEPEEGTTIIIRFNDQKLSRKFTKNAMFQEVYDWAGAMSTMPPHFTLQRRSEVVLHEHHIKGQEVLDVYEREENEVKRLLNSRVGKIS
ncbi:hypothetical protein P5673_016655 [Acropora cervicornis]|uniref:UBX domain-containing protein n=1 Tax=Acropora cervicornis TaxID=6130 RepID=A0AAD9QGQ9_ACRCE|nr:hypothetical protein P5673_016655 [Acropora cervicornis]